MTRAPRSRKKKAAANNEAVISAVAEAAAATDSLHLPLAAPEHDVAPAAATSAEIAVAELPAADVAVEAAPLVVETKEAQPAAPAPQAERSSMRIDVTEDRSHLGPRLRAAREVRGWSREDVAHRLHVPTTVIADIEAERFERLGAPIYVRGYLSKYAQLVELPMVVVNRAIEGLIEPDLRASTEAAPLPSAWDRHKVTVIGGLITLAVATSVVTLVANRGIHAPVPQVRSLDESELVQPLPAPTAIAGAESVDAGADVVADSGFESAGDPLSATVEAPAPAAVQTPPAASQPAPVMASMAGFSAPAAPGAHVLEASFREDSWIEIFDADGRVIEQNLVRAGQSRRYESTGAVSIKIGNVGGVDVRADGNPIDLVPHARANVARLRLFEAAAASPTP